MMCPNTLNNHFRVSKNVQKPINYLKENKIYSNDYSEQPFLGQKKFSDKVVINISKNNYSIIEYEDALKEIMSESTCSTQNQMNTSMILTPLDQTLNVINALKEEKEMRRKRKRKNFNNTETSFSHEIKLECLMKDNKNIILPNNYKKVLDSFRSLEKAINNYKFMYKSKSPTISEISNIIEGTKFSTSQLRKIVYIVPHFFVFKWQQDHPSSETKLLIDIPLDYKEREKKLFDKNTDINSLLTKFETITFCLSTKERDDRMKIFTNILWELVKNHHNKFLEKINFRKKFENENTFHNGFDINRVPPLKEFFIPENPQSRKRTVGEYLRENDIKTRLVKATLESNDSIEISSGLACDSKYLKDFCPNLRAKIVKKIEAVNISKNISNLMFLKKQPKYMAEELKNFIENLRNHFIINQSNTKEIEDIYNSLKYINTKTYSKEKFITKLHFLADKFPDFISIYKNEFVKINKEFSQKKIFEKVDQYCSKEENSIDLKEINN